MNGLTAWFLEGGVAMIPIALFGFAALVLAGLHALIARFGLGVTAAVLVVVTLLFGAAGTMAGRHSTERAIAVVEPEMREEIRAAGYEESSHNLELAGLVALLAAPLLVVGEVRRRRAVVPVA